MRCCDWKAQARLESGSFQCRVRAGAAVRSFVALHAGALHRGGWVDCILWARSRVVSDPSKPAKIFTARPGAKRARVVAEVSADQERLINGGRLVPVRTLRP